MSRWLYDIKLQRFVAKPASGAVALSDVGPIAQNRIVGRVSAGDGPTEQLTPSAVADMLGLDGYVTDSELATAIENIHIPAQAASELIFLSINTMTGVVPRLVGSALLPAGTYQAPSALLGAGDPAYSATLTLETQIGDVLATVGGVAGGVAWRTASAGFVLAATTLIEVVLVCSAVNQPAFVHGLSIIKE